MRGELMDYLDSNPEDDNLTETIRSAIVGVTRAEEVYEMMIEMNRIGFEDSDCEDQEEHHSASVISNVSEMNEEPAETEESLPSFSISDEVTINHTLKLGAYETVDHMNLAIHGANKLWEYVAELRSNNGVPIRGYIESESKDDETMGGLKDDRGIILGAEELASEIPIFGVTNQDPPLISECSEEPIIEGRVFDIGNETRPMEPNMEVNLEASPATLYVEIPVSLETFPGMERDYDSKPINPGKDPEEWLRTTQNHDEDEGSGCLSAKGSDQDNRRAKPDIEDLQPGVLTLPPPARSPTNFARPDEEPIDEMNLAILEARMLLECVEGSRPCDNVHIKSCSEPEQQDEDVDKGIQNNHGTMAGNETSTPKVHELMPFNQMVPCITTTCGEPVMEGRMFDVGKDTRPMESDEETKSKESPEMEAHPDRNLNMEESQAIPDKGTPVSLKPLPKIVKVYESEPIKPGKDPGTSSNLAQKSKEVVNSSCSRVWKFKGTKFQDADKPNNSEYEAPRNGKPASNGTRNEVEVPSEDSSTSPEMDISYESIPIGPGKDPEIHNETTTGASKTKRSNDRDTEATIVKDKSGGKPLISNKQLKPGWNPSRNSIHGKVFEEVEAIKLTDVVGESKFEVSPTRETCSSNGKTRGFEMSNDNGLPINVKTKENEASKKNVVFSNDLQKYLEKSLRPSQKLKEKINSKCSTVWRVKDWKSNESWMVKNKSGGKPLHGWDPPAIYSF